MVSELKKASWPSKKDLVKYTGVVLAFVVILAVVIGVMDFGLAQVLKLITG
jgi:preprotein translocase subunit SecE